MDIRKTLELFEKGLVTGNEEDMLRATEHLGGELLYKSPETLENIQAVFHLFLNREAKPEHELCVKILTKLIDSCIATIREEEKTVYAYAKRHNWYPVLHALYGKLVDTDKLPGFAQERNEMLTKGVVEAPAGTASLTAAGERLYHRLKRDGEQV